VEVEGNGNKRTGIRWNRSEKELNNLEKKNNLKTCVGIPNSRGNSTWFILPNSFLHQLVEKNELSKKLQNILNK